MRTRRQRAFFCHTARERPRMSRASMIMTVMRMMPNAEIKADAHQKQSHSVEQGRARGQGRGGGGTTKKEEGNSETRRENERIQGEEGERVHRPILFCSETLCNSDASTCDVLHWMKLCHAPVTSVCRSPWPLLLSRYLSKANR